MRRSHRVEQALDLVTGRRVFDGCWLSGYSSRMWWIIRPGSARAFLAGFSPCCRAGRLFHPQSCPVSALFPASPSHFKATSWDNGWLHQLSSGDRWQRVTEHLACGPPATGSPSYHGWRPLSIPRPQRCPISLSCLHQGYAQRAVRTYIVIIRLPPVQVSLKVGSLEGCRPRASCQSGHATTECEIDPLDKRGVHSSRKAHCL
jgi:hypothetical protein